MAADLGSSGVLGVPGVISGKFSVSAIATKSLLVSRLDYS